MPTIWMINRTSVPGLPRKQNEPERVWGASPQLSAIYVRVVQQIECSPAKAEMRVRLPP